MLLPLLAIPPVAPAALPPAPVLIAQVIPDTTLGPEPSIVTPDVDVRGAIADRIDGGAIRGTNLFHSFSEFNIDEGDRVYFSNPIAIDHIFSRVTGANPSNIFGTLGVDGPADLFLMNPNGILFGENASLDIDGSFVGTTASSIQFADGAVFGALTPAGSDLLTVSVPLGLQYGPTPPGSTITNRGTLQTGAGFELRGDRLDFQGQLFSGGNLTLLGTDSVQIRDVVDNPFIAASLGEMVVQGDRLVDIFALSHPSSGLYSGGDMTLRSANPVGGDAHYWSGGSFRIEELDNTLGNLESPRDPIIRSAGDISFGIYIGTSLHILAGGSVNAGGILITGPDRGTEGIDFIRETVTLSNGDTILIDGSAEATVDIRAGVSPEVMGTPGPTGFNNSDTFLDLSAAFFEMPNRSDVATSGDIEIGVIQLSYSTEEINSGKILLTNQYQPNQDLLDGNIKIDLINASDSLIDGFTGEGSVVLDSRGDIVVTNEIDTISSLRDSGDITLLSGGSVILDGATLTSSIRGSGNGGNILIQADQEVSLSGPFQGIINSVTSSSDGQGGNIYMEANSLSLSNFSIVDASTFGDGNAGKVSIDIDDTITLDSGSRILNNIERVDDTERTSAVSTGGIDIQAQSLTLSNASIIDASTLGNGDVGKVVIDVDNGITLDSESDILSNVGIGAVGDSGGIEIRANSLSLSEDARILAGMGGRGDAGDIFIQVNDFIILKGENNLFSPASTTGIFNQLGPESTDASGGNIILDADTIELDGAVISTGTFGSGSAGDISITTDGEINLENSAAIFSNVNPGAIGDGGDIKIDAGSLSIDQSNIQTVVQAPNPFLNLPAGRGSSGNITVTLSGNLNARGDGLLPSDDQAVRLGLISAIAFDVTEGAIAGERPTAGDITVVARDIVLDDRVEFRSVVDVGSIGEAGDINVQAESLTLSNFSELVSSTSGQGNVGNIELEITNTTTLNSDTEITSSVNDGGNGNGGTIILDTGSLLVQGGQIGTFVGRPILEGLEDLNLPAAQGDAGNIAITVRDAAIFEELTSTGQQSGILSGVFSKQGGQGGSITFKSDSLNLENAQFNSETSSQGDAGNITISTGQITLSDDSQITSETNTGGAGGSLTITAEQLRVLDGSIVQSTTFGAGNGGTITVNTGQLELRDGSTFISDALQDSTGNAGSIFINATESIEIVGTADNLDASGFYAQTRSSGDAGNLQITTQRLSLRDGGAISTETAGSGDGANLTINASESIDIVGGSPDQSFSSGIDAGVEDNMSGNGGDIDITTGRLMIRDGGFIASSPDQNSTGNSGSIVIQADDIAIVGRTLDDDNASGISIAVAEGATGNAGDLEIETQRLVTRLMHSDERKINTPLLPGSIKPSFCLP